jgi:hypothetical protein
MTGPNKSCLMLRLLSVKSFNSILLLDCPELTFTTFMNGLFFLINFKRCTFSLVHLTVFTITICFIAIDLYMCKEQSCI